MSKRKEINKKNNTRTNFKPENTSPERTEKMEEKIDGKKN